MSFKNNTVNIRFDIQAVRISEYKDILNTLFTKVELQKLKLKLNIIFKKNISKDIYFDDYRNFFYIWNI